MTSNNVDESGRPDDGVAGLAEFAATKIRLRLDLGYDGTDFSGWARQPGLRTVQSEVESALATVLRLATPPSMVVAGRTDAGVHARGQVAHVDLHATGEPLLPDRGHWADDVARRLNGVLPLDVRVKGVSVAPPGFDARFSALSRRYSYRVADGWLDPLRRRDTLFFGRDLDLDLDAMNEAAAGLLGLNDFAAFCRRRVGATTVRTLLALHWSRDEYGVAIAHIEADAFCHSMVRSLVGVLFEVGIGREEPQWPAKVLAGRDRAGAATVAPPHGLTLEGVRYPPDDELPARAEAARARRDAVP